MFHNILTPLDGSMFGEHALPLALAIARRSGASLKLLHVQSAPASIYSESPLFLEDMDLTGYVRKTQQSAAQAYLNDVMGRITHPPARVTTLLAEGEVRDMIRAEAAAFRVDLVVMTTHGRGPFGRLWLGAVADEMARTLPIPVLLVRPRESPPDLSREAAVKRILIALDSSSLAEQIIEPALEIGTAMGAEFTLLRAVRPAVLTRFALPAAGLGDLTWGLEQLDKVQRRLCDEAEKYLEATAVKLRERSLTVRTRLVVEDQPALGILGEAQKIDADLIALATHGRRGLSRLVLGSVADKVLRGGHLPVLLMRPKKT